MKTIKRKLCAILCAAVLVGVLTPTASAATFSDVSNHWAAGYIETCADLGIVDGIGGGRFNPDGLVTNAQFIKMLCAAFYSAEEQTFENENRAAINTYFGSSIQWYAGKSYYFEKMGLLTNVSYNIQSSASANQPMTRNNMAQVAANVLAQKGIAANEDDKALAQAKLTYVNDYYNIPENNRDAVKTCYALGIITGTDGGKFDGGNTMTRAQACTVITRLLDVVGKTPDAPTPIETPTTPAPLEPTEKEIQVSSSNWSGNATDAYGNRTTISGDAWTVTDNGFGDGRLNNGKPITEENVIELLHEAEKIWPNGIKWSESGSGNNFYKNSGTVVSRMLKKSNTGAILDTSSNFACGGFASMISDYIFGRDNNNFHRVTNFADIRPGDIIVEIDTKSNRVDHVFIAVTAPGGAYTGLQGTTANYRAGYIHGADGNMSDKVYWPGPASAPTSINFMNGGITWQVYSRYPA